jgi:histidinol-phosphatase
VSGELEGLMQAVAEVARLAGDVAAHYYRTGVVVDLKADGSPVTVADRTAEEQARRWIEARFPGDGVLGEEFGLVRPEARRRWVIDPIDGTKSFVRGVPVWATLIALVDQGRPVLGVVSAPALNRRWWAALGSGAWTGRSLSAATRLQVSRVTDLADASLSYSSLWGWESHRSEAGGRARFLELTDKCWRTRAYGDFWSYVLVAEGAVDIAAEPELAVHDMAALVPIVTEAGGRFTSLDGVDGPFGGNALATNGHLHTAVLSLLSRDSATGASSSA